MKKIIALVTLVFIMLSVLTSCKAEYKSDVKVSDIADKIKENLAAKDKIKKTNNEFLEYTLGVEPSLVSEFVIMKNSENYDEFGVIKAKSKDNAKEVQNVILEQYFPAKDGYMKNYFPDLYAKIQKAECLVLGDYVVYFILSESERTASIKDVKDLLKK